MVDAGQDDAGSALRRRLEFRGVIRVIAFAAIVPLLIVLLWDDAPQWAILVGWGIGGALVLAMYVQGNLVLKCPNCGKRVKIGYTTCHHCGAHVGREPMFGPKLDPATVTRECPHCKSAIRPDASVCPHCQRDVEPWVMKDGTWWMMVEGEWLWLDPKRGEWVRYEEQASPTA